MKSKLVVVTDLGAFKAYRLEENPMHSTPRLELVDEFLTVEAHEKLSDRVTDQAGQFSKGSRSFAAVNDMSNGERHNMHLEQRRRLIKQLAQRMNELLRNGEFDECYFAAHSEINNQFLESLEPSARGKISRNVPSNLTRLPKADLLDHFLSRTNRPE